MQTGRPFVRLGWLVTGALALFAMALPGQLQTMSVTKIADGVYGAIYSEMIQDPVHSNSLIVIGDDGVAVVDADYTPGAARATIAEIRKLTKLPVRYVITTHWHDDHVFGNQEYQSAYPGVEFVAHRRTRESMVNGLLKHQQELTTHYCGTLAKIDTRLAKGIDGEGKALTPARRAELKAARPLYQKYCAEFKSVRVVLPTVTFDSSLTLHLGAREIQVRSFGRANTFGDAVIFLPKDRIAAVGDMVVYPVPYIYGGFPVSWQKALQAVRALDPAIIIPGHGPVMREFSYIDQVSAMLASMASQVHDAVARGLTLEQTRKVVDLTAFHDAMVHNDRSREETWASSILDSGIAAAFKEATELAAKP